MDGSSLVDNCPVYPTYFVFRHCGAFKAVDEVGGGVGNVSSYWDACEWNEM